MIRVAILSPAAELGGAERSLLTFLKAAHPSLIDATVILPRKGPLCRHLDSLGVPCIVIPQPTELLNLTRSLNKISIISYLKIPYSGCKYLQRLTTCLQKLSPEILYSNGIKFHFFSSILSYRLHIPVVWHVRDQWSNALLGLIGDLCPELIIANSQATAAKLRNHMRGKDKVVVIHNAVDIDEFSPEGPTVNLGGKKEEEYWIGLPGPLAEIKGQKLFLRAAQRIRQIYPLAKFFIIGGFIYDTLKDRAYEAELRRCISEFGLAECVSITGFQVQMAPWYRSMDVIVNTSIIPEGFGRTLLEAMACGRAVIGPNAGGIPEFVQHGKAGFLYEMASPRALVDAVIKLLNNDELRTVMGSEGRRVAVQRFSLPFHAESISKALQSARNSYSKRNVTKSIRKEGI